MPVNYNLTIAELLGLDPHSAEFREAVAAILRHVDPNSPFGTALYDAIARLSWNVYFEGVCLRRNTLTKQVEVFMRQRALDDSIYPGEWHAPGSAFRPGETERDVANRLAKEFGPNARITEFEYAGEFLDPKDKVRGSGISRIYCVVVEGNLHADAHHGWYPVDQLPSGTISFHRAIISTAVFHYTYDMKK